MTAGVLANAAAGNRWGSREAAPWHVCLPIPSGAAGRIWAVCGEEEAARGCVTG